MCSRRAASSSEASSTQPPRPARGGLRALARAQPRALGTRVPRRVRVLFLTTSYPSAGAPATGIFVHEHARAVAPHAEVAVLHLDRSRGFGVTRDRAAVFPTWRARYPERPLALTLPAHLAAAAAGYGAVRRAGFAPDVVHAHFFLAGVPAVLTAHPVVVTEQ